MNKHWENDGPDSYVWSYPHGCARVLRVNNHPRFSAIVVGLGSGLKMREWTEPESGMAWCEARVIEALQAGGAQETEQ